MGTYRAHDEVVSAPQRHPRSVVSLLFLQFGMLLPASCGTLDHPQSACSYDNFNTMLINPPPSSCVLVHHHCQIRSFSLPIQTSPHNQLFAIPKRLTSIRQRFHFCRHSKFGQPSKYNLFRFLSSRITERPLKIEVVIDFSTAPLASRLAPVVPAAKPAQPRAPAGAAR